MSQFLRLLKTLALVALLSGCASEASVKLGESGSDGDTSEQDAHTEHESDADAATHDGDVEPEMEAEKEAEAELEAETEDEAETEPEAEDRDTELPRAERLPFDTTRVLPCADQATITSANAVWGDGEGLIYFASQHVWIYDETTDTLSCLPETFGQVWTLNGRRVDGTVEVWALGSTRLGRYRNAAWTFYPLPNGDTIQEWCTITYLFPVEGSSISYCGFAWLAFNNDQVIVRGERAHDIWDSRPLPPTFLFMDLLTLPSGEWLALDACSPANDFEGFVFEGRYFTMGHGVDAEKKTRNLLFEFVPEQAGCQVAHEFAPGNTLRLYGADSQGLYIGEYDFSDYKNNLSYGLKRAFVYNPSTQATAEIPLPGDWQTDLYAVNGISAEARIFHGESIGSSLVDTATCRDSHLLYYPNVDASYSVYQFGDSTYPHYGDGCLGLRASDGLNPTNAPRLRHWGDAKTVWLPNLPTRITYAP